MLMFLVLRSLIQIRLTPLGGNSTIPINYLG